MNCTPVRNLPSSSNHAASVVNPLCIILVKNGSKGDRLLFRYPYSKKNKNNLDQTNKRHVITADPNDDIIGATASNNCSNDDDGTKNVSFDSSTTASGTGGKTTRLGGTENTALSPGISVEVNNGGGNNVATVPPNGDKLDLMETHHANSDNQSWKDSVDNDSITTIVTTTAPVSPIDGDGSAGATTTAPSVSASTCTLPSSAGGLLSSSTAAALSKSPAYIGTTTKSLFDTPLSQLSSKSFTPSPNVAGATPEYGIGRMRKVSRTIAPVISRGDEENPYSVSKNPSDDIFSEPGFVNSTADGRKFSLDGSEMLSQLSDKNLSNLLAVNSDLAERKFELKLNFVRFVGHPTLMHNPKDVRPINPEFQTSVKIFHIVFCLNAAASHSIVKCFFDLSKRLGIGLRHEEYRCGFLNQEMRKIILTHDEACTVASEHLGDKDDADNVQEKVFDDILAKSKLAQLMKHVYDDVCNTGYTFARINNWVQISFCLPHRIHVLPFRKHPALVEPETIHRCLEAIRPYHALLLLVDPDSLNAKFWLDSSSTIPRLLQVYSPLKSLQTLAADADLTLSQVVEVASHLVYWAHATVIYPLCESNVYVLAPDTPLDSGDLEGAFRKQFPQLSLIQVFSDFSSAIPLGERMNPMIGGAYNQSQLVDLVTWMLQRRLLIQLHTYIYMATYLDMGGGQEHQLDQISVNVDPDISLNLNVRPFDFPEEDDVTVSDTFSETTGDDAAISSPLPLQQPSTPLSREPEKQQDGISNTKIDAGETQAQNDATSQPEDDKDRAKQNNNNEEVVEPLDKFRSSLPELNNEAVKRAVGIVNKVSISVQDIKMFSKLSKYFTGEFHVEEIMYRENVRRSQLMLLLDKFRECLITVEKEDADISFLRHIETT